MVKQIKSSLPRQIAQHRGRWGTSIWLAVIALPLVEVHIKGYGPRHEQTKQNTIIDLLRQMFGEYNLYSEQATVEGVKQIS